MIRLPFMEVLDLAFTLVSGLYLNYYFCLNSEVHVK